MKRVSVSQKDNTHQTLANAVSRNHALLLSLFLHCANISQVYQYNKNSYISKIMHNFPSTVYEFRSLKTGSHSPIGIDIVGGTGYFLIFIQLSKNHFHL